MAGNWSAGQGRSVALWQTVQLFTSDTRRKRSWTHRRKTNHESFSRYNHWNTALRHNSYDIHVLTCQKPLIYPPAPNPSVAQRSPLHDFMFSILEPAFTSPCFLTFSPQSCWSGRKGLGVNTVITAVGYNNKNATGVGQTSGHFLPVPLSAALDCFQCVCVRERQLAKDNRTVAVGQWADPGREDTTEGAQAVCVLITSSLSAPSLTRLQAADSDEGNVLGVTSGMGIVCRRTIEFL